MSFNTRIAELAEKHRTLERKIQEELTRPAADGVKLRKWKHEKLKLKDEIRKLELPVRH